MNTRELFYEDSYIKTCEAQVLECVPRGDSFAVILDQTCFYPEGGGQPGDTGFIGGIRVTDTHKKDGRILHYTNEPVTPGAKVAASIDWDRRFDYMQQHSGEHMLSGLVHERYGLDNVGFHMGADITTIDFSDVLTMKQLKELEEEVNRRIVLNDPVKAWYPAEEELKNIPYRSKKELTGQVRIVEFPGTDLCACCGTHVRYTGEIGLINIISCEKFHSGVRLELVCGLRALRYLDSIQEQNRQISHILSAKPLETAMAVESLSDDLNTKRMRIYDLEEALFSAKANEYAGKGDTVIFIDDLSSDAVRRVADALQKTCGGRACVFSGNDENGYKYAIGLPGGDLRAFIKDMNQALNGRGGGKPEFVQGSVNAWREEILRYLSS